MPPQVEILIRTTLPRARVMAILQSLPAVTAGQQAGAAAARRQLLERVGLVAQANIRYAFQQKASGGKDESGLEWRKLKPETIAYKRRHPKLLKKGGFSKTASIPRQKQRAGDAPSYMLTKDQRARWWKIYGQLQRKHWRHGKLAPGLDKGYAARVAWTILKAEGAKTLIGVYGTQHVEILKDTSVLFDSLSPGAQYNVFRLGRGNVELGTSRPAALYHHEGIPGRLPQRRLWPETSQWPTRWWDDILNQATAGVVEIARSLLTG